MDNLLSVSDSDSSLTMSYDVNGRMLSVTTGGIAQPAVTLTYSYDANGNRTLMTSPIGTTSYTYDNQNRLVFLTDPLSLNYTFAYDSLGRRTGLNYPNGVTTTYTYDSANRLTSLSTLNSQLLTLNSYAYNYDTVGNRTSLAELTGTHDYTYDNLYQLTEAAHPTIPTEQFNYDPVGNRLTDTYSNTYNYNIANQLLDYDGVTFEYDNNGNMVSKTDLTGTTAYTYDSENRLIQLLTPASELITYRYDTFGRRIEKDVNGQVTKYVYDKEGIIFEYDGSNSIVASYTHNLGIDDPLAIEKAGQTYYYHMDALGSTTTLTDETGNVAQTYEYDSFGNIVSQTGNIIQPFTYTAREYDSESGLYYYRARYYDAKIGRFISEDPILKPISSQCVGINNSSNGFAWLAPSLMIVPQNLHPFIYVGNNPVNWVDPLGLGPISVWPIPFTKKCLECDSKELDDCIGVCLKDLSGGWDTSCEECAQTKDRYACMRCQGQLICITVCYIKHCRIVDCDSSQCKL